MVRSIKYWAARPIGSAWALLISALIVVPTGCGSGSLGGDPPKTPVVITSGTTAAGTRFVATLSPHEPRPTKVLMPERNASAAAHCRLPVAIEDTAEFGLRECLSEASGTTKPEVFCNEPLLVIDTHTLAATRSVSLRLSDGHTVTSRPITLPSSLGGPAGLYYQAVRGPTPVPTSITEIDADGAPLRTVILPHVPECTAHAIKRIPDGVTTLVRQSLPGGPRFSIVGEHYALTGQLHFDLKLRIEQPGKPGPEGGGSSTLSTTPRERSPLAAQMDTGCSGTRPYVVVYGLLRRPGDTVFARSEGRMSALRRIVIPKTLHIASEPVYAVLARFPDEIIVRTPHGQTIFAESYAGLGGAGCPGGQGATVGTIG